MKQLDLFVVVLGFAALHTVGCVTPRATAGGETESVKKIEDISLEDLLNQPVTSATMTETTAQTAPSIITVITDAQIATLGLKTLGDVFELVPGFTVLDTQLYEQRVIVRGVAKPANILLLLNGQPVNDFYDGTFPTRMSLENVERIEVIRGPGSSLYGTNAFSGVVSVFTKRHPKPPPEPPPVTNLLAPIAPETEPPPPYVVEVGGGGELHINDELGFGGRAHGRYAHRFGDWGFRSSVEYYRTQGPQVTVEEDSTSLPLRDPPDPFSKVPGETSADFQTLNVHLGLFVANVLGEEDTLDISSTLLWDQNGPYFGPQRAFAPNSQLSRIKWLSQISHDTPLPAEGLSFHSRLQLGVQFTDNEIQRDPDNFFERANPTEIFPNGRVRREEYLSNHAGAKTWVTHEISDLEGTITSNVFLGGVSFFYSWLQDYQYSQNFSDDPAGGGYDIPEATFDNHDNIDLNQSGRDRTVFATFVQNQLQLFEAIWITAGLRFDFYSDFGSSLNPRLAVVWKAHKALAIKALYGRAFRAPTFKELYDQTTQLPTGETLGGNEKLEPETTNTMEVGVEWSPLTDTALRVNGFFTQTDNAIEVDPNFDVTGRQQHINFPGLRVLGFEAEVEAIIAKRYRFLTNISWFDAQQTGEGIKDFESISANKFDDLEIREFPNLRFNFAFSAKPIDELELSASYSYVDDSENNTRLAYEVSARFFNRPAFHKLSFKATIFLLDNDLELYATGNIALDRTIPIQASRSSRDPLYQLPTGQLQLFTGLTYHFGAASKTFAK